MKKFLAIVLAFCCSLLLFSCTQEEADVTSASTEAFYDAETTESEVAGVPEETLSAPVMIDADFEVETNADGSFYIRTNLPDETELSLTLSGKGYLAQGKAYVENGVAVSERFTRSGAQLVGEFTLEVLMPIPSVQSDYVRYYIGQGGEYLTGPYVKSALGSVVVSKEFNVSFLLESESTVETIQSATTENYAVDSVVYYRTPTGTKYHLDPDCGGKNSYVAKSISDLSPCKKCVK